MEPISSFDSSAERYQIALEAAGIGIWDHDLLADTIFFSANSQQLFGFPEGYHFTRDELFARIFAGDRDRLVKQMNESLDPNLKAAYDIEFRITDQEGAVITRWVRAKGKAYFNDESIPYRLTGTLQDITTEVKARETQQKLLALVDNSIELMSILENDQKNSYLNRAGMEMLGFDNLQQVYETPISALHTPEDIAFVEANVLPSVFQKGRWSGMMNVRHLKTGEIFPVYNNTVRIEDNVTGEPIAIGAVMRDMRPEMATRRAIEESERNFRNLVMQAPVGICIIKGDDLLVELVNDSFLDASNKTREELLNKPLTDVFPEASNQGFDILLKKVLQTGIPYFGKEYEILQQKNGESSKAYADFTFQPLHEPDGSISRIMTLSFDVTDKVLARKKLQENEEELQRRVSERTAELEEKNKALEEFTYVSSHDLQEPIRKIRMFMDLVKTAEYSSFKDSSRHRFNKIEESVDRMSTSLKDLLNFASLNKEVKKETVDLNNILRNVLDDLELMINEKNAVLDISELPTIEAVPVQMNQLFYNLLINSLKFSREGVIPHITIKYERLEGNSNAFIITIADNGIGFEQEKEEKIFGMFQRLHTRDKYDGTGIGLALCKKVVENHDGKIWARSTPGEGAAFHIMLPLNLTS